jgi:mRNA interferase RelE/StbE
VAYRIDLKNSAAKDLQKLPQKEYLRISDRIKALGLNPRPQGVKKLKSSEEKYRIRVGNYRVLYMIDDGTKSVTIYAAGDRKDIYRYL